MNNYSMRLSQRRWPKVVLIIAILLALIGAGAAVAVRKVYNDNLRPVSNSQTSKIITIPTGATTREIAIMLDEAGVIRKSWAFEWYVRNKGLRESLQAGTYSIKPSLSTREVVAILTQGKVASDLVTILPGQRIDQIRDALINYGFDQKAVDRALDPATYPDHPALVDKPKNANLEGYIYPESFHKTAETDPASIIRQSLDEMHERLTPGIRAGIVRQGLTVHEGVILASIIEQEVGSEDPEQDIEDKKKVAQVFLKRLEEDIALESDATTDYGAILAGREPSHDFSSPYNTYENKDLPPGPISNVGQNSLAAVADPADTDFLFFVAGNDCITRFSHTVEEHDTLKRRHGIGCRE